MNRRETLGALGTLCLAGSAWSAGEAGISATEVLLGQSAVLSGPLGLPHPGE